eukprot:184576-Hanusia_phi.AAC.3
MAHANQRIKNHFRADWVPFMDSLKSSHALQVSPREVLSSAQLYPGGGSGGQAAGEEPGADREGGQ